METLKSLGSTCKSIAESCFLIGKGLTGYVSTIELTGSAYEKRNIEYIRICNGMLYGSLVVSFEGVLSKRQAEILPYIQELQKDITPLYYTENKESKLYSGPSCGSNTVNIVKNLRDKYKITMIAMEPEKKDEFWRNHLGQLLPLSRHFRIQERNALWGVGTTIGVIYHALPVFVWEEEKLYISVETTLFCGSFQLQFHVTESLDEMIELMQFRYLADNVQVTDNLEVALKKIKEECNNNDRFNEEGEQGEIAPQPKLAYRGPPKERRPSLAGKKLPNAIAGKKEGGGKRQGKKTRKQKN